MSEKRPLSLVPYSPPTSKEVVLQHGSSVVVYDPQSGKVSIANTPLREPSPSKTEEQPCPVCQRPFINGGQFAQARNGRGPTPTGAGTAPDDQPEQTMNSGYFRMLNYRLLPTSGPGSSQPGPETEAKGSPTYTEAPHLPEEPPTRKPPSEADQGGISSAAFSQNYFGTFFVNEGVLGKGGKGVVLLVQHVLDGFFLGHFACKRVPVGDNHAWLKRVLHEVQLLQRLSHQNLVSYRHVWLENCQISRFGPSVPCAFILQEYCNGGDLLHYILEPKDAAGVEMHSDGINSHRKMNFEDIFSFFKDITSGLYHLHSYGYLHRDLKPSNCLLNITSSGMRVLVSDFGEVQQISETRQASGATGTISFCAPEVLRPRVDGGLNNFTIKSDIFALGMIVYFMCFGRLPFKNADSLHDENEDIDALKDEICGWSGFDSEELERRRSRNDLPDDLYKFLRRLLSLDPDIRPDTGEILQGINTKVTSPQSAVPPHSGRFKRPADGADGSRFSSRMRQKRPSFSTRRSVDLDNDNRSPPLDRHFESIGAQLALGRPSGRSPHMGFATGLDGDDSAGSDSDHTGFEDNNSTLRWRNHSRSNSSISQLAVNYSSPPLPAPPTDPPFSAAMPDVGIVKRRRHSISMLSPYPIQPKAKRDSLPITRLLTVQTVRVSLFLLKYYWISDSCHPLVPSPVVSLLLITLALADFVVPIALPFRERTARMFGGAPNETAISPARGDVEPTRKSSEKGTDGSLVSAIASPEQLIFSKPAKSVREANGYTAVSRVILSLLFTIGFWGLIRAIKHMQLLCYI